MYAFTLCMWIKSGATPGIGTPFSYGVPGQANEIVLIEWGNNPIELLINDKASGFLCPKVCVANLFYRHQNTVEMICKSKPHFVYHLPSD